MPTVYKLTSIFQATTVPEDLSVAVPHTGGWTESVWTNIAGGALFMALWNLLQSRRQLMLPGTATILGWRYTAYDYDVGSNFLIPGASTAGRSNKPGVLGNLIDLPQVALQIKGQSAVANSDNLTLRGFPDDYMKGGEYCPTPALTVNINAYFARLTAGNFGFIGRDKTQVSVRVLSASAADGILVNNLPTTGLVVGNFVRLNRVIYSLTQKAIVGSFRVTSIVGNVIHVDGWPAGVVVAKPSGTLRRDQIAYMPYTSAQVIRAVVKKVGSPLEKYRGRRSKRRVA